MHWIVNFIIFGIVDNAVMIATNVDNKNSMWAVSDFTKSNYV